MKITKLLSTALLLSAMGSVQAEYGGIVNGQSMALADRPNITVAGAYMTGKWGELDYTNIGSRFTYKATPALMLFGDFGRMEVKDDVGGKAKGNIFGGGAYYQLNGIIDNLDLAAKAGMHKSTLDNGGNGGEIEIEVMSFEAVISSRNGLGSDGNIQWYANLGAHRFAKGDKRTEFGFGAGLIMPFAQGEIFGGVDQIEETQFGIGYRHFL